MIKEQEYHTNAVEALIASVHKTREFHKYIREKFKLLNIFFKEHGFTYWVVFGTLLGAIRHRGIIPWDFDIDIQMKQPDINRLMSMRHLLKEKGLVMIREREDYYSISRSENGAIDIFVQGKGKFGPGSPAFMTKEEIFPLRTFPFYDEEIYGPRQAEQYLYRLYGPDCLESCKIYNYYINSEFVPGHDPDKYVLSPGEVNAVLKTMNNPKTHMFNLK